MKNSFCFLDARRSCEESCMAYDDSGKHSRCKILNTAERLIKAVSPTSSRPTQPPPTVK